MEAMALDGLEAETLLFGSRVVRVRASYIEASRGFMLFQSSNNFFIILFSLVKARVNMDDLEITSAWKEVSYRSVGVTTGATKLAVDLLASG